MSSLIQALLSWFHTFAACLLPSLIFFTTFSHTCFVRRNASYSLPPPSLNHTQSRPTPNHMFCSPSMTPLFESIETLLISACDLPRLAAVYFLHVTMEKSVNRRTLIVSFNLIPLLTHMISVFYAASPAFINRLLTSLSLLLLIRNPTQSFPLRLFALHLVRGYAPTIRCEQPAG